MYILILTFPLLGFFCASLAGKYFGREGSSLLVCIGQMVSLVLVFFAVYEVIFCKSVIVISLWHWVYLDGYAIAFGLLFDSLTCTMLLIIMIVSSCVHFYSVGYMAEDPYITRFLAYLSLFTFFMLFLVCSDNFLQLFIGWEGVGLCSYLLINFWYKRILANKAALKAMVVNRIADVLFFLGIIIILLNFKTLDFVVVFDLVHFLIDEHIIFFGLMLQKIDLICFFLFIGAAGKSAQLGLHTWLPDAMEGPTPVSALLHAATMVTAGVFLLLRCSPLLEYSNKILFFIAFLGGLTSWFFSIVGAFQYDIKKVIAYSTCSQLGYMFFSCGLSLYQLSIFHLFNHAFFKALLFLSAGSVIHALFGEQDMRRMGSTLNFIPFTYFCFFLGSLTLTGFPFLTGFYSKDLILELSYERYILDGSFIYFLGMSGAFFTAFYSVRLLFYVFFFKTNFFRILYNLQESNFFMAAPLFLLSLLSIMAGYLFSEAFIGWGTYYWNNSLFILPSHFTAVESEFVSPFVKNLPMLCSIISLIMFFFLDHFFIKFYYVFIRLAPFFFFSGFFNALMNNVLSAFYEFTYDLSSKTVDKGYLEFFGPFGLYRFFFILGIFLKKNPATIIFFSICLLFFAVSLMLALLFFYSNFIVFISYNLGQLFFIFALLIFDFFFMEH